MESSTYIIQDMETNNESNKAMKTFYYTNYASTHFDSTMDYYKFIKDNHDTLVLIDADIQYKIIRWRYK